MKTFLVYSKKPIKFIFSVKDIANIEFVKYGMHWLYLIDIINILYTLKRKFFAIAAFIIAIYILVDNIYLQTFLMLALSSIAYILEGIFLKHRKYNMVATIEAKNANQAKEYFIKEYILPHNRTFISK